ncbi:MAG: glutamate--tRNA ligase [Bacteroidota bacterium]
MEREVRVRFAPSPTGSLHIGGVRTALYNYLLAKQTGGKFIIRIEDTDQNRFVPGAEEYIFESLAWCGITPDEGPNEGGPFAPYRQSERKPMYMAFAQRLVDEGNAYYAFDTSEELDEMRERLKMAKVVAPQYNAITRATMKNSLTLPEDEVKARLASGDPYVIRLKVPRKEEIRLHDMIRGWVMVHSSTLDDKVLMKSDGMPTYHLANVVDDHLMEISHVIRGEEWLPSAPTHVLLYRAFGWEDTMPQFAHLPLLLKPDGNGKLSKRDGDALGFPVFPIAYTDQATGNTVSGFRESGYLPEAMVNFLAFLGWNPGTQQEIFSMDELVKAFSVERIGKSGTKFDIEKARWFNKQYLHARPDAELAGYLKAGLEEIGISIGDDAALRAMTLVKDRTTYPKDFATEAAILFQKPDSYDEKVANSKWTDDAVAVIGTLADALENLPFVTAADAGHLFHETADKLQIKAGKAMQPLRLAITGKGAGPDLMTMIEILGPKETAARIRTAIHELKGFIPVKA